MPDDLAATRRSWHAVAELVLAGPQYRHSGTIRLRVTPGGFGTTKPPALAVDGGDLVAGENRVGIDGRTCAQIGAALGVDVGAPADLYHDGPGVDPDEPLRYADKAGATLAAAFELAEAAMRRFAPRETPVLWPEHFDLGVAVSEVNYGVSPGDGYLDEPYAYVSPWSRRDGPFWTAPFGAARPLRELDDVDALVAFFSEGRALA
jgi:hypothetical protein